jgi:hypothetical protein
MNNGSVKMENDLVRDEIWHYFIGLRLYLWLALNAVNQGNVNIRELTLKKEQYIRFLSDLKDDLSYVVERGLKKVPIMTISKAIIGIFGVYPDGRNEIWFLLYHSPYSQ